jgi:pimeloyl-ACP methyl ester carboxylesterase
MRRASAKSCIEKPLAKPQGLCGLVVDRPAKRKANEAAENGTSTLRPEFTPIPRKANRPMMTRSPVPASKKRPAQRSAPAGAHRSLAGTAALLAAGAAAATAAVTYARAKRAERRNPPVGRIIEVDGVRVHVHMTGEGPPLVLLNGNGTMVQDWLISGLVDGLRRDWRVICIDRPGYGYTGRPRTRLWTAPAQADLMAKTLRRLGIERPAVLGHSWGTMAALALALDHPETVRGLVLLSGYYFPTRRLDAWAFTPPAIPILGDAMRYTVSPLLARMIAPRMIAKMFEPLPVPRRFTARFPLDLALRPWQIRASAEDSAFMVPGATALAKRYRELHLPVAILSGTDDRVVTPERQSVRLADYIEGAELTLVPGVGHMLHYSAHNEIARAAARIAARSEAQGDEMFRGMEASPGIEPGCKDLQSSA